jgi:hypothetical protein
VLGLPQCGGRLDRRIRPPERSGLKPAPASCRAPTRINPAAINFSVMASETLTSPAPQNMSQFSAWLIFS